MLYLFYFWNIQQIVSNKNSEVDVDKWDYFARDYLQLGMRSSFDHDRFIQSARVCPDRQGKMQLCVRDKVSSVSNCNVH